MYQKVYIAAAKRTPIGSFGSAFVNTPATTLGAAAIRSALDSIQLPHDLVEEIFMGNVCSAGLGQAPARQAAILGGIPSKAPASTINKVCSSGLKATMLGAQSIMLETNRIVISGGMENMSMIPYYLPTARWGSKYGHGQTLDGLQHDGLTDSFHQKIMGVYADNTATKYNITREEQDAYAMQSYTRSKEAWENGHFDTEVCPVEVAHKKDTKLISRDEEYTKVDFGKIPILRPAFSSEGSVTAANASTINDGAAAIVLVSESQLMESGLTPLAEIIAFADAAHEPEWFTTAPVVAATKALHHAKIDKEDIDLWEVNEAFAVVSLLFAKEMAIPMDRINIHGGAVSLGHPLGASGARILTTLVHALHTHNKTLGCVAICNGGGGASSMIIKKA